MKKLICILLTLLMVLGLAACGGGDASTPEAEPADESAAPAEDAGDDAGGEAGDAGSFEGETLVVGVWGGTIEEVLRETVVEPMEEEYGCSIELVLGGTGDRVTKLYTEKDNPSMDVFFLNIYESKEAIEAGVADDVNPSLSNFGQLYDFAQVGGYGMSIMGFGICYNNELVTEPITSWKDLWRPELKGKVSLSQYPGFEGSAVLAATAQAWDLDLENDPDAVFAKLAELGPFPLFYSSLDELFLELQEGTVLAATIFNSYSNDYIEQGFPCEFVYPEDPGPILAKDTIVIAANTQKKALAEEFVNRCIGVETQTAYAERIFFSPCNKEVTLPEEVAAKLVYGDDTENLVTLDWTFLNAQEEEYTEMWNRQILGA